MLKIDERSSIEHDFHKTPNIYSNRNADISNDQQLRLNKILLLRLETENY